MEIRGLTAVVAYFVNRIMSIESSEFSLYQLTTDHTCNVSTVIPFPGPVRSVLECAVGCLKESNDTNLCYNNGTSTCTCCSATSPSGPSTTQCYRRKAACSTGWTQYYSSCYKTVLTSQTWASSESHCRGLGGHLVDIHDSNELQFVEGIRSGYIIWIGLNDRDQEGTLTWSSSANYSYNAFYPHQPNGDTAENCIVMYGHTWRDYPCSDTYYSVCEKEMY